MIDWKVLQSEIRREADHRRRALLESLAEIFRNQAPPSLQSELDSAEASSVLRLLLDFLLTHKPEPIALSISEASEGLPVLSRYSVFFSLLEDRPFVVASIRLLLRRQGLSIHHLFHPILYVLRGKDGEVTKIGRPGTSEGRPEALQMVLLERMESREAKARLEDATRETLQAVIAVTDDFPKLLEQLEGMKESLSAGQEQAQTPRFPESADSLKEYLAFLDWLRANHFVFLGFRRYDVVLEQGEPCAQLRRGSGLGILRRDEGSRYFRPVPLRLLPDRILRQTLGPPVLLVAKANSESPVYRSGLMDYVGLKHFGDDGSFQGESRILGMFSSRAYLHAASDIPILRRKLNEILNLAAAKPGSHDYRRILALFNSFPLTELFVREAADLWPIIRDLMSLEEEEGIRVRFAMNPYGRGISALVSLPKNRFSSQVRQQIQEFLADQLQATGVEYRLAWGGEEDERARLHFMLATSVNFDKLSVADLERSVADLARSWEDRLRDLLQERLGPAGAELAQRYGGRFPTGYKAEVDVESAALDIRQLERLSEEAVTVALLQAPPERHPEATTYLRIYHPGTLPLAETFPILQNLGLRVVEQIAYQIPNPHRAGVVSIDIFRVQDGRGLPLDIERDGERLKEALLELLERHSPDDPVNRLVLTARLSIREVMLVTTWRAHVFQLVPSSSLRYITQVFLRYPESIRALVDLFHVRFRPEWNDDRSQLAAEAKVRLQQTLDAVETVAEDELIRRVAQLIERTVRTNFYWNKPYIANKVTSSELGWIPEPKPWREIFVWSPQMEGVHLRGGPIARGGLRWSDRPDDFRTEILGLMKTQMVKNALIVPQGAKGGFVLKHSPSDRDRLRTYVQSQYGTFIRGLLDLTDNVIEGKTVAPEGLVTYDEPDPYLVVAADKGTATFSDLANQISREYSFWLGDAFASGGSHGYDHKKLGITARGAWECVKRHFLELGLDPFRDEFTVIGIGDMSGDVFGNGMLYTEKIRLLAAFNHQHIFLDPTPAASRGYQERLRLFRLPNSSWSDYDPAAISPGGGVFPRSAKSIPLSPEIRELLQLDKEQASGLEIIRAMLKLPADLLWNGGIGTYVKASWEPDEAVGDPTNRHVRVNAGDLRVRVVGEGGNLGFTQAARVEFARRGGRINTDAVDNSGGVDMSDHEVNLKLALAPAVHSGKLTLETRNRLLTRLADEMVELVLANNASQALCLSLAQRGGPPLTERFQRLQERLAQRASLRPDLEGLPTPAEVSHRLRAGNGYTRPELAVLLAYSKLYLKQQMLERGILDESVLVHHLIDYFPREVADTYQTEVEQHPLRRHILATRLTNLFVDRLGISGWFRLEEESERPLSTVIEAMTTVWELTRCETLFRTVLDAGRNVNWPDQYAALERTREAFHALCVWLLLGPFETIRPTPTVERFRSGWETALEQFPTVVQGVAEGQNWHNQLEHYEQAGVSPALARSLATAEYWPALLTLLQLQEITGEDLPEVAYTYFSVGELFALGVIRDRLAASSPVTPAEGAARQALISDLRVFQLRMTSILLGSGRRGDRLVDRLRQNERYKEAIGLADKLRQEPDLGLAEAVLLRHHLFRLLPLGAGQPT